jgi:hypothetical protein
VTAPQCVNRSGLLQHSGGYKKLDAALWYLLRFGATAIGANARGDYLFSFSQYLKSFSYFLCFISVCFDGAIHFSSLHHFSTWSSTGTSDIWRFSVYHLSYLLLLLLLLLLSLKDRPRLQACFSYSIFRLRWRLPSSQPEDGGSIDLRNVVSYHYTTLCHNPEDLDLDYTDTAQNNR